MNKYDLIIIGGGPCGLTSAIYSVRNKLNVLVLTKDIGGQMAWSGVIENYTGYKSISGPDLTDVFEDHAKELGSAIKMERVASIKKDNGEFIIMTDRGEYSSIAVLIASGKNPKFLNIPGENEYKNKGVVYCATCDGPLYGNKKVAIIGGGNSALDAASQLINIASHVYIVNKNDKMKGDVTLFDKVNKSENATFIYGALTKEIKGNRLVESITYTQEGKDKDLEVDGVFVQIGLLPNASFIDSIKKNEFGEIVVDSENNTSVEGIFAAGDVTNIFEKQIIIAAGDGSKAALSAFKYIAKRK